MCKCSVLGFETGTGNSQKNPTATDTGTSVDVNTKYGGVELFAEAMTIL